jgi:hypothetical protein
MISLKLFEALRWKHKEGNQNNLSMKNENEKTERGMMKMKKKLMKMERKEEGRRKEGKHCDEMKERQRDL